MIESMIESRILSILENVLPDDIKLYGLWENALEGELKGEESKEDKGVIVVGCGQCKFLTFGQCICEVPCTISFVIRVDLDVRGELLLEVYDKISQLLMKWNLDENNDVINDLSVNGFIANMITMQGGDAPKLDKTQQIYTCSTTFTITGNRHLCE